MNPDIAIIGAGAAGMAAAIFATETAAPGTRITLIEGARRPGAKILVSGGGRCNVTNRAVTPGDYWGGPSTTVRNVLRVFPEERTIEWMRELGVELKLEPTGKYFPVTDQARTVLDALLRRISILGVELRCGVRVKAIAPESGGFRITMADESELRARRVILCSGGRSLPKSGSDGWGIELCRTLGHRIVPTTPALAPMLLEAGPSPGGRFAELSGLTMNAVLLLLGSSGREVIRIEGSLLFTHFGLSGPVAMNFSRHYLRWKLEHRGEEPRVCLSLPQFPHLQAADAWLQEQARLHPNRTVLSVLSGIAPERMARMFCAEELRLHSLPKGERRALAEKLARLPLRMVGDRGWSFAETTAGGVDLREVDHRTMESRIVPGLHLCGELLDVDGRIGGFNFQWAWASGHLAGRGAAAGCRTVSS